jgi:hypothetical protein
MSIAKATKMYATGTVCFGAIGLALDHLMHDKLPHRRPLSDIVCEKALVASDLIIFRRLRYPSTDPLMTKHFFYCPSTYNLMRQPRFAATHLMERPPIFAATNAFLILASVSSTPLRSAAFTLLAPGLCLFPNIAPHALKAVLKTPRYAIIGFGLPYLYGKHQQKKQDDEQA